MKVKAVEYLANILPDGHLSIPDEIRRKLKKISKKKVRVSIEIEASRGVEKKHPAFGIWADLLPEDSSAEIAEELRNQIESRADGI